MTSGDAGDPVASALRRRLDDIRRRIESACRRVNRDPGEVLLVAVTKSAGLGEIRALASLGIADFGENRVHVGEERRRDSGAAGRWHMVGRLQTNKVRRALGWADVLHSLDRPSLADRLEKDLKATGRRLPVYMEVNVAGETQKAGVAPEEAPKWIDDLRRSRPHLDLQGLMTMAPHDAAPSAARGLFRALRELAGRCGVRGLSMGMSADFEIAVEEGATAVRIGTALFRD